VCALVTAGLWPLCASAVTQGQKDDFESGTTQGWQVGAAGSGGPSPVNVTSGGPGGATDNYMRLTSTGTFSALSKLVAFNTSQWTGAYDNSVGGISMQLANFEAGPSGNTTLQIRIALRDASFNQYVSRAFPLPADGQWHTATWNLNPTDFPSISGGNINTGRNNILEMRLMHSLGGTSFTGDTIAAIVGVDNITALPVPEPGVAGLAIVGLLAMQRRGRAGV
jgi:hypothetical protein